MVANIVNDDTAPSEEEDLTVLELLAFNAQTALIDRTAALRQTDRQTYGISAIHCVYLAEKINKYISVSTFYFMPRR